MIPAGVTSIGSNAFSNCSLLTSITVDSLNSGYSSLNGLLFDKNQTTLIQCPGAKSGSVIIPASVTKIGSGAFSACTSLMSAYFLGTITSYSTGLFSDTNSEFTVYFFSAASWVMTSPTWQERPSINMGISTASRIWLISNGFSYNADLLSDPNGDGIDLLTAYALNLDPRLNLNGSMPLPLIAGNQLSLTFYAGSPGVSYSVEASSDLINWTNVTLSTLDANNSRTASVSTTDSRRFLRIVVSH